jgi:hypothetical protein
MIFLTRKKRTRYSNKFRFVHGAAARNMPQNFFSILVDQQLKLRTLCSCFPGYDLDQVSFDAEVDMTRELEDFQDFNQ